MLRIFDLVDGRIAERTGEAAEAPLDDAAWLDLHAPDERDRARVERAIGGPLPEPADPGDIEATARAYVDERGIHLRSLFLVEDGRHYAAVNVGILLQPGRLVTVRPGGLRDFRQFRAHSRRGQARSETPPDLLIDLLEQKVDTLGAVVEKTHRRLEETVRRTLEDGRDDVQDAVAELALLENRNGKVRLALVDTQRAVLYLKRQLPDDPSVVSAGDELVAELTALLSHATFLFERINFLMSTTQGLINIEQNKIIKTFSIAAVVFLPPTLIASIYGMNFRVMPELEWLFGYPFSVLLMIVSGVAPYLLFRHKGWL